MSIMQAPHNSEINAKIESFYDGCWRGTLGDEMNGWNEPVVEAGSFDECEEALADLAVKVYPNSVFARGRV